MSSLNKGVHPFIAATILILVTVVLATLVSGFVVNVSSERSKVILNATQTKLSCQYAGLLVTNVTYDCNSACFTGSPYKINATIENTGSSKIIVENMFISLANGISYRIASNASGLSAGGILTKTFDSILATSNPKMPTETMDTRNEYQNDTNTRLLCHFESTPNCISKTDGTGNATGVSYDAGRFYNAIKINESDTLKYNATNINISQGTMEFWLKPNWSGSDSTSKSFISIESVDRNVSGEWRFEEKFYNISLQNITDSSPYGNNGTYTGEAFNNGTISGAAWNATGKYGYGLTFDGIDDYADVGNGSNLALGNTTDFTLEAWVYPKSCAGSTNILSRGNTTNGSYELFCRASQALRIEWNYTAADLSQQSFETAANTLPYNQWSHVAVTYNTTTNTARLFINGTFLQEGNFTQDPYAPGNVTLLIGAGIAGGLGQYWNGSIDELRIYSRVLTGEEINASMNSKYPANRSGLVSSWRFEEASGNTAYDTHHQLAGRFGGAMSFDGVDDYVNLSSPSALWIRNNITVMSWIYSDTAQGGPIVTNRWDNNDWPAYGMAVRANAGQLRLRFFYNNQTGQYYDIASNGPQIPLGWSHIAVVRSIVNTTGSTGNTVKYYVNGVLQTTDTPTDGAGSAGSSDYPTTRNVVGGNAAADGYFNGTIDEVRIYNKSLTAEEINATYHAGLASGIAKNGDILVFKWGSNATLTNISSWSANTWYHVAGTWDSNFMRLYVDGGLKSTAATVLPSRINESFYVGSHWLGEKQSESWLDELRISNMSRNFTVNFTVNVSYPNTNIVRIYNDANALMNTSGTLNGVPTYNVSLNLSSSSEYRVEVEDTGGNVIEKWYPYRTGGSCDATSTLDKVTFSAGNCPEVVDAYYGSDVTFVSCV